MLECNNLYLPQVRYLRQFTRLQSLALAGNPLASQEHYQHYVIAFVPSLVYLDFRMVMEEEVRCPRCKLESDLHLHNRCINKFVMGVGFQLPGICLQQTESSLVLNVMGGCVIQEHVHTPPIPALCCSGGVP